MLYRRALALIAAGSLASCGPPSSTPAGDADGSAPDGGGSGSGSGSGVPYPTRDAYRIKGLQPDFWPDADEIAGNHTGGVAINLFWTEWENTRIPAPCADGQLEHGGHCFSIPAHVDDAIRAWTARGVVVTAVVYGVPVWARRPACADRSVFCAPADPADFARFAGLIAKRYDGTTDTGRLADFVIHNEVNVNSWYDAGCGRGTACDVEAWMDSYAADYAAAYDAIVAAQPHAKVLVSLEHHFAASLTAPNAADPVIGVETFLRGFAARIGDRAWRVAFHPYPPDLRSPQFSAEDLPKVTYGNIGVLAGWLRKTFPDRPSTWEIQLTESGVNSVAPSSEAAQADAICRSFQNVLGTPGIESYIYHRMKDHPTEVAGGLALGLRRTDGTAKPAWATWATANRIDLDPPQLSCGFEHLPYVQLTRAAHASRGHWVSSRVPPAGFGAEQRWRLHRDPQPGTHLLYECAVGAHNVLTREVGCEGLQVLGPVGYAFDEPGAGRVPLYRCNVASGADHFVSTDPACEGAATESLLGYALP